MSAPRIDVLTIFPELIESFCKGSLLGAALAEGRLQVRARDLRAFASGPHKSVDSPPYGGGDGMVMRCEPAVAAVEAVAKPGSRVIALSPRGRLLTQSVVNELAQERHLVLLCGRYAGFDERILEETRAEELSIGDYVLSGGEAAALVVVEAISRLVPGVVGNPESPARDSFCDGTLEHPLYTRPREFRGRTVPEVLLSGNHAEVERWRRERARELTRERRPDLLAKKRER